MVDTFPYNESSVELYIGHLSQLDTPIGKVKSALSAIAWHHKAMHQVDPTKSFASKRMLISLGRAAPAPKRADPITLHILEICVDFIRLLDISLYEKILIKSLLLTMYYGCLRVGEAALSSNPDNVLKLANSEFVTIRGLRHFKFTLLTFKHSKTSATMCIPPNPSSRHCPVSALWDYFKARPRGGIHCFVLANSDPVPRSLVANLLAKLLDLGGFKDGRFTSHSLRAGRATDLAAAGVSDAEIRATGRWSSDAFKGYLRFPILPPAGGL